MSLFIKVNSTFIGGDSTLWQKLVMDKIMVLVMAEKNYYTALSRRRFVVYLTGCAAEMPLLSAYLRNFNILNNFQRWYSSPE